MILLCQKKKKKRFPTAISTLKKNASNENECKAKMLIFIMVDHPLKYILLCLVSH